MNCSCDGTPSVASKAVHSPTVSSLRIKGKYPFSLRKDTSNSDADADAVAYPSLTALDLCGPGSGIDLTALCKPDRLTKLELVRTDFGVGNMTSFFGQLAQLRAIEIVDCQIMMTGWWRNLFQRCRGVEYISITTYRGDIGPTGFAQEIAAGCAESLLELRLCGTMAGEDLASLPEITEKCTKLQRLLLATISWTPSLQGAVQHCHAVRELELRSGVLDDALLQCIGQNCPLLQSLCCGDISTCTDSEVLGRSVPEDGMAALIQGCRQLRTIELITDYDEEDVKLEQARSLWAAKFPQLIFK
jgi:hypothetical protein